MITIDHKNIIECIDKRGGYFIFYDTDSKTYGVIKDEGQKIISPPHCGYYNLETLLKLKGIQGN